MSYADWKQVRNEQQLYGAQIPTLAANPQTQVPNPQTQVPAIRKIDQPQDQNDAYAAGFQTAMAQMGQSPDPSMVGMQPPTNHMNELQKMDTKRRGSKRSGFQIFSSALYETGISNALSGNVSTQMTVFAPTDDAFKVFGETDKAKFKGANPQDRAWAESLLESHIVEAEFTPDMANGKVPEVAAGVEATTVHGSTILRLRPRRDPQELLPAGAAADEPLVQLVDGMTGKILAQSRITGANWIPGTGTVFSIDKLLVAPKS